MTCQTHCAKLDGKLRKRKLKSFLRHGSTNLMSKEMGIYLRQKRNMHILKTRFQHPFVLLKHCLSHRNSMQRHTTSLCFPWPFVCFPVLQKSGFPEHRMTFGRRVLGSGSMGTLIQQYRTKMPCTPCSLRRGRFHSSSAYASALDRTLFPQGNHASFFQVLFPPFHLPDLKATCGRISWILKIPAAGLISGQIPPDLCKDDLLLTRNDPVQDCCLNEY